MFSKCGKAQGVSHVKDLPPVLDMAAVDQIIVVRSVAMVITSIICVDWPKELCEVSHRKM